MEKIIASLPRTADTLRVSPAELADMTELLRQQQIIFPATGGTHAAGIYREGKLLAVSEDLGRHNAFDKAIGKCILEGIETAGAAAVLSSRVSFEMVAKAARAGIELIAAVSAPSTLAIETARRCNITLCGFVRGSEANVYCCPHRILD
jgi:FdhD protein